MTTKNATKVTTKFATKFATKVGARGLGVLLAMCGVQGAVAATVVGELKDISIQALDTKVMFAPTNEVLVTPSGLSAGPPKVVDSVNGQFSLVLEAGDYTVSLPLIPWRHGFQISVMDTNGTVNITNLLSTPRTYTYTNNLNFTVKATTNDVGPDVLDRKLSVAGTLSKYLVTNAGVVTVVLSNSAAGPLHVNVAEVNAWSTNGEGSLLDGTVTLPAGTLTAGKIVTIEAFGSFSDPGGNVPNATLKVKLGSTAVVTETQPATSASWHLRAMLTARTAGISGTVIGAISVNQDNAGSALLGMDSQTATVNTTGSLTLDLRGSIDDSTGAERVACEQLVVSVQ